jgi:hypothetical protein
MAGKSMREVREWDQLKTFFDRRLIEALGHPLREHILAVLNERIASATEIGEEIGADVSSFYHHVEELEKRHDGESVFDSGSCGAPVDGVRRAGNAGDFGDARIRNSASCGRRSG